MEDITNEPAGIAGKLVSFIKGLASPAEDVEGISGQRQDSVSGTGNQENAGSPEEETKASFPVKLVNPGGDVFKFYGEAAEAFQREIVKLTDAGINWLTIGAMTTPSIDAPVIHKTPFCGFPVTKADKFSVLLSNGVTITA